MAGIVVFRLYAGVIDKFNAIGGSSKNGKGVVIQFMVTRSALLFLVCDLERYKYDDNYHKN